MKKRLNNGELIPAIGIETFLMTPDQAEQSVATALKAGYQLIDTANAYVNEKAVGRGIKKPVFPEMPSFSKPSFGLHFTMIKALLTAHWKDWV